MLNKWVNEWMNWWMNELFSDSIDMKQKNMDFYSSMGDETLDAKWNSTQNIDVVKSILIMRGSDL